MKNLLSLYFIPRISTTLVYMLQSVEYHARPYLVWFWRTQNFASVMKRRTLDHTRASRLLRLCAGLGMLGQLILGLALVVLGLSRNRLEYLYYGLAMVISYPIVWAHLLAVTIQLGQWFVVKPRERKSGLLAKSLFGSNQAIRISVAGSYGKTTMKELLMTVLSEGKKVAATPGNMNVLSSHAKFAQKLTGQEEILLIEFGEGKPGDVARFTDIVQPTHVVITGLAPAHLDQYKTLEAAGSDIFTVTNKVAAQHVYVNAESEATKKYLTKQFELFSRKGSLGWKVSNAKTSLAGTEFILTKAKKHFKLSSQLVGLHQVGPLALAATLGLELGLSVKQVQSAVAKTKPFEHRMQPYLLAGATIIDDTYNGNLEGIRVGTEFLAGLTARRKIYVTPGLVDQGKEVAVIHNKVGEFIAAAKPDVVVLMQNSVTRYIQAGLSSAGYSGELIVQDEPLDFYTHLADFVASGDVVLMQNDWTDNYN